MAFEYRTTRRVEFHETDMAGIVHFSNFFRYMEATEHEFFRSLGLGVHDSDGTRMAGLARVAATCEYEQPLRYPEEFEVHLVVNKVGTRSIGYEFRFQSGGQPVAHGSMTVVCVSRDETSDQMRATELPADVVKALEIAPESPHST